MTTPAARPVSSRGGRPRIGTVRKITIPDALWDRLGDRVRPGVPTRSAALRRILTGQDQPLTLEES